MKVGALLSSMFGKSALKAAIPPALGGLGGGVAVVWVDKGREALVGAVPALSVLLDGNRGRIASSVFTALVGGGLVRKKSALAAAGLQGAMAYQIGKDVVEMLSFPVQVGLSGSIAEMAGSRRFLGRLRADRKMAGSLAQPSRTPNGVAGSFVEAAKGMSGTAYGGAPVSANRAGKM